MVLLKFKSAHADEELRINKEHIDAIKSVNDAKTAIYLNSGLCFLVEGNIDYVLSVIG